MTVSAILISAEWTAAVKVSLIVFAALTLAAVLALLVLEIIGRVKKETFATETQIVRVVTEPAPEPAPQPKPEPAPKPEPKPNPEQDEEKEEISSHAESVELTEGAVLIDDEEGEDSGTMIVGETYLNVRYNRSFTAKLIQSDDMFKSRYNSLRNELTRYGLKRRISWNNESWYKGRTTYVKFAIRGKTLSIYLALDPKEYVGSKYTFKDVSEVAKYRDVPMQRKVRSERAVRWTKELITALAEKYSLVRKDMPDKNYRPDYQNTTDLVREGQIKLYYIASKQVSSEQIAEAAAADLKEKDRGPRDFTTKLMRADSVLKSRYSEIKNELLRYGMSSRMSKSNESWYNGRTTYVKFAIRGKTLCVYLALDPKEFEGTKYNFRNVGDVNKYESVPMYVRLKSDRSVRWLKELLATMAEKKGWERSDSAERDFRYVDTSKKPEKPKKKQTSAKKSGSPKKTSATAKKKKPPESQVAATDTPPSEDVATDTGTSPQESDALKAETMRDSPKVEEELKGEEVAPKVEVERGERPDGNKVSESSDESKKEE